MKSKLLDKQVTEFKQLFLLVLGALLALVARFPFSSAEDIINARENINSGQRIDFWGAFSPWFFTRVQGELWEETYAFVFTLMIFSGALLTLRVLAGNTEKSVKALLPFFLIYYCSMLFALDFSRDGSLLAFFWIGFGVYLVYHQSSNYILRKMLLVLALLLFSISLSFRPWMTPTLIIFIIVFNLLSRGQRIRRIPSKSLAKVCITLLIVPIIVELTSGSLLKLNKSYPEQQVIIMDLASIGCLSSNPNISIKALTALTPIAVEPRVKKIDICSQYYPSSVGSVLFYPENWGNISSAVQLIDVNAEDTYQKIRSSWLDLLLTYPKDFIQIKFFLGSQWLLAGDSNLWRGSPLQVLLLSPLSITRELRLFSGLFVLMLLIGLAIYKREKSLYVGLLFFYISSLSLLTVAFTGDNQRYLVPFSMISLLTISCKKIIQESK